jgi:hypothetical protein
VANWIAIGENMVNLGFMAGTAPLRQDFISTDAGSVLGVTPSPPRAASAA